MSEESAVEKIRRTITKEHRALMTAGVENSWHAQMNEGRRRGLERALEIIATIADSPA